MESALFYSSLLVYPAALIFIIYLAVNGTKKNHSLARESMLALILLSATLSGLIGFMYIPNKLLGISSDSLNFAIRVAIGVAFILVGLAMSNKIQKNFMLILGLLMIIFQAAYVFNNFGSYGAFIVVAIAFVALIFATIYLTKRQSNG